MGIPLAEHPLLRLLAANPWFRWVCLVVLLLVSLMMLSSLRVWRASPPDFRPVVRVSLFDKAQARSLRRSAIQFEAAGKPDAAAQAWQSAIANEPANPDLFRGALRQLVTAEQINSRWVPTIIAQTSRLLRLSRTNQADVELVAEVCDRYELSSALLAVLDSRKESLKPREEAVYLKALFRLRRMDEFAQRWQAAANRLPSDPQLSLFHAAYLVGWGPLETRSEGRRRLDEALVHPQQRMDANRLHMTLCAKNSDVTGYAISLGRLQEWRADRAMDHAGLWELMLSVGQAEEARRLAEDYVRPPLAPWEAVGLAEIYLKLGLHDYTHRFLERYVPEFANTNTPWLLRLWRIYADVLIQNRRWHELREVAFRMRLTPGLAANLGAYSYFLEGRALQGTDNPDQAGVAFTRAVEVGFREPQLAFETALELLKLGYPNQAWGILVPLDGEYAQNIDYWKGLFKVAYARKDSLTLFKAASRAYALHPEDPVCQNNYAASLLISRQRPDEAVKLTLALTSRDPALLASRINHSYALAMNRRFDEAEVILKTIDSAQLAPSESTMFHFAAFEVHAGRGDLERARQDSSQVNTNLLFPSQVQWLKQALPAL